jgi:glycyl-tRNA synthetase beta chain
VRLGAPGTYVEALRDGKVLVDPDERRERIVRQVEHAAAAAGGMARIDTANLEQVNCLVEWPSAVSCSFERDFLAVPQEALIATMETNQKFFPVLDDAGRLTEHFVGIANIESKEVAEVRKGYERVIRPRFADAKFFFEEDLKQGLASMGAGLASVTYQAKLGTLADKVARVAGLAATIAAQVGVDPQHARRAAELSKADLQSRLVNEFPELQGIAGRHYAQAEGEPADVAAAIDEAYMPRFGGDAIAPSKLGQVLAIAERLDTLAG